jgi:hypothetical protein
MTSKDELKDELEEVKQSHRTIDVETTFVLITEDMVDKNGDIIPSELPDSVDAEDFIGGF